MEYQNVSEVHHSSRLVAGDNTDVGCYPSFEAQTYWKFQQGRFQLRSFCRVLMLGLAAGEVSAEMILDEKGRCCGRKPIVYKSHYSTAEGPQRYCPRCDRSYHITQNRQVPNWAWRLYVEKGKEKWEKR